MRCDRQSLFATLALFCLALAPLAAQETDAPPMDAEMMAMMEAFQKAGAPGEPHEEMAASAGSWKFTMKSWMDPSQPPMESMGTAERVMTLDGRVIEEKVVGDMMGQTFHGIGRRGYNNVTGKYWATWTDSMSTGVFMATGSRDETGAIVMHGEYPNPMNGAMIKVRSVHQRKMDGRESFEWYEDHGEGEIKTMEIIYERTG